MGVTLAADAAAYAASAQRWGGGQKGGAERGRLMRAYQAGGAAFCLAGAALCAGVALWPRELAALFKPMSLGRAGHLAGGAFFAAAGILMGGLKLGQWASPGRGGRLAFWAGWFQIAAFLTFGSFLLSRLGGHPK